MGENRYIGQLKGPFLSKEELFDKIKQDAAIEVKYVKQIGIQAEVSTMFYINKELYEIGKTGIYEIGNTEITSIYFENDVNENTIIDYIIE